MSEDLYEELELGMEDIYEDLPDIPYDDTPISPPPLPSTPIPSLTSPTHKAQSAAPPLPNRATTTVLSSKTQTLPVNNPKPNRSGKTLTMKSVKPAKGGGGGGGIDISEIMKKARERSGSSSAIMDLETKIGEKKDDNTHMAPWANQLRKTPKVPPPKKDMGEGADAPPSWVKRQSPTDETEPEFIRKRKEIQALQEKETSQSPPSTHRPLVASKPPAAIPNGDRARQNGSPHSPSPDGDENKPAWLRQRDRQLQLAQTVPKDDKPAVVPKPAAKPPPIAPKANKPVPTPAPKPSAEPLPLSPRKPRPIPAPRTSSNQDLSLAIPPAENSSELNPPSVMAKAKMFSDAAKPPVAPKVANKPLPLTAIPASSQNLPPISPRTEKKSPTPPPIPMRDSSMSRAATSEVSVSLGQPNIPERKFSQPLPPSSKPPVPAHRVSSPIQEEEAPPPPVSRPPPLVMPLPPANMPPPPTSPPPPSRPSMPSPPTSLPPSSNSLPEPKLPSSRPPQFLPATQAQPTPPTGTVLKFRRRPLQSVNLSNPPPLPSRNTKPARFPAPPPLSVSDQDDGEEIYEDTMGAVDMTLGDGGTDDLYDDVSQIQFQPPVADPSSQPLPSVLPPTLRPPLPPVEGPKTNYTVDPSLQQNGVTHEDVPQDLYEDLNPDDSYLSPPSTLPSSSSPLPPSPSLSSLTPSQQSPTTGRKQQKKLQKEEEKKKKEMKKREETKAKNRQKGLKQFKEYKLPLDVKPLFTIEILEDHPKGKDHVPVTQGEVCFVLLISHDKLPNDRYFVEKEDGTMGYVKKTLSQRINYESVQSVAAPPVTPELDYEDQDIYEKLPQGEEEEDALHGIAPPPALPPPNKEAFAQQRFPAPSQPPPPPPDEPQDTYEYLPDDELSSY